MTDDLQDEPVRSRSVERREVVEPARAPSLDPGEPVLAARPVVTGYYRAIRLVWFVAGVLEVLIGLRFALKLFGASSQSPFVDLVYGITAPFVAPFRGIFPVSGQGPFILHPAALV